MNKSAIQRFAIWARTEMKTQVKQRAYQYGIMEEGYGEANAVTIGGRALSPVEQSQRKELVAQIQRKGYEQVMEEVAYTWFNRFIALRYMEVNNYLPSHIRVFSDSTGTFKPEILNDVLHLDLPGLDAAKVAELIESNQAENLYRYLLLTQCNALNESLPRMFERMGGYTELLLPNNILKQDGILGRMVAEIPEEDWTDQVQIIGWLYQYYNSEYKDETFALLKKNVKITKERIPSATQLFTPDWIVRYMVENSLGRLWLEGHPDGELKAGWKYYLDEARQEAEVEAQLEKIREENRSLKPQNIKVIDPCMGSGHILVYAFDVLIQIYKKYGVSERDAAQSIMQNNLYGLDIDDRAAQLAYFAVMMKARQYDRRIFFRGIQPNVYSIVESNGLDSNTIDYFVGNDPKLKKDFGTLVDELRDAKEYGSILNISQVDFAALYARVEEVRGDISLFREMVLNAVEPLIRVAEIMAGRFDVVVTNPPYMGNGGMGAKLSTYVKSTYPNTKSDLSTVFMEKTLRMCSSNGYMAMINIPVWMFLASYEQLRKMMIANNNFSSLLHIGRGIFGADFGTTSFVIGKKKITNYQGTYRRLFDRQGSVDAIEQKEKWFFDGKGLYIAKQDNLLKIPGAPLAYWVGNNVIFTFEKDNIGKVAVAVKGLDTCDNQRFVRQWEEVNFSSIGFDRTDSSETFGTKWYPYCKGGGFRRWYGFNEMVVNWLDDGEELRNLRGDDGKIKSRPQNIRYYFKEGLTWSSLTSYKLSLRYMKNAIFGGGGSAMFTNEDLYYVLAVINSKVGEYYLNLLNPTINFLVSDIMSIPFMVSRSDEIDSLVKENIILSKRDYDSFETSWDFGTHPLRGHGKIKDCYLLWENECEERFSAMSKNERRINEILIEAYMLSDELTPDVVERDIEASTSKSDMEREIKSLISYAVGCMFGRYSLDMPGLAYAGGEWDVSKYTTIIPDKDNIIPICDDDYFDDDITGRFVKWVETVYGKDTLEENLKFIADALDGKSTPREVIRNYFINDFYADHLKIYQKRPIYWLFDSGKKNGFKALIYMHRYQSDLLAKMRTDYVHEQQERYRTQLAHLSDAMDHASTSERVKLTKQQKKIQDQALEIQKYEEKIHHLADQNISIDLDDGVKHNYALFADVLAKIK